MQPKWSAGIVSGLASAVLYLTVITGSPLALLTTLFSPLPLFLAGLSMGTTSALIGAGTVGIILFVLGNFSSLALYVLTTGIPAVLLVYLVLLNRQSETKDGQTITEWYPAGRLLAWAAAYGIGLFSLVFILTLGNDGGLQAQSIALFREFVGGPDQIREMLEMINSQQTPEEYIEMMGSGWPALTLISLTALILGNAGLAQRILVKWKHAIRPSPSILTLELPEAMALGFLACLILSSFSANLGFFSGSVAAILSVPYFLLGLSVVHVISTAWSARTPLLTLFYMALIFIYGIVLLVAFIGLVEQWMGLRKRFTENDLNKVDPKGE